MKYTAFEANLNNRFAWLKSAITRNWYPTIVPGGESIHLHVILESKRWENPLKGMMNLALEVYATDRNTWSTAEHFELFFDKDLFEGCTYIPTNPRLGARLHHLA